MAKPVGYGGRDYPDFGVSTTASRHSMVTDMSELAVRLGALSWFDRMGNVLMQEGFQNGLTNWGFSSTPAASTPVVSAEYYSTVPYSVKLLTTIAGAGYSGIHRSFPFPYVSNFGVELHFKALIPFQFLHWTMTFSDGANRHRVMVRVNYQDLKLELLDASDVYQEIGTLRVVLGASSPFHVIKCTVDLLNSTYIRLLLDGEDYDVSAITIKKRVLSSNPYLYMEIIMTPVFETEPEVWIDNIIFTTDEPV